MVAFDVTALPFDVSSVWPYRSRKYRLLAMDMLGAPK